MRKKDKLLEKLKTYQKNLEEEWNEFLKRYTYLTFDEKKVFLDKAKRIIKFPWYYRLSAKFFQDVQAIIQELRNLKGQIKIYNNSFSKSRLDNYTSFFEGKDDNLKFPFDSDQRQAIVKDDRHNLVIAGAGSGKTSVITSRIAYLTRRKDKIENERILALAFTRVAAQEMRERLLNLYNIDIIISTFHALGLQIITEGTGKRPKIIFNGSTFEQNQFIESLFRDVLTENKFQHLILEYLTYHLDEEVEEESFEDKEEYFKYMKNKHYTTLNNIVVKSVSERDIGNFLFRNNTEFQYEPLVNWVDESKEDKEYHPDFYLPDYDIYIEHWGLNKELEVPFWFSKTSKEYNKIRKWKLSQFKKYNKILVETWEYERIDEVLIYNLKQKLLDTEPGIKFIPKSYEELIETTEDFKEKTVEIAGLMTSFIKIAKSNFLYPKDIEKRAKSKIYSKKQRIFGQIALEVYTRYQDFLIKEGKIDFNDMINKAVEIVKNDPKKYINTYDHVLVDEFQDISYQRLQLINGFIHDNLNSKLFCVGDDWQSIYQFTGSDLTFFTDFEDFFVHPEISLLKTNYRCSQKIVEMSNDLISKNKNQIKKTIYTKNKSGPIPIVFEFTESLTYMQKINKEHIYSLIENLLSNGVKPEEIMVISRFNRNLKELEIHCGAQRVPIQEEVGGKIKRKGMRFYSAHKSKGTESKHVILMDIISGVYGFPCEIQDSSVFEIAQRFKKKSFIEEERRLFYVALTRCKEYLYVFTIQNNISMFLIEIEPYLKKIFIDSIENWNQILSRFISNLIQGKLREIEHPIFCKLCGRLLKEREGKYGKFLGCTGYPKCRYIYNFVDEDTIQCPDCGKPLVEQTGRDGKYLRCLGFPDCKYKIYHKDENDVACPSCGGKLAVRKGKYGMFLGCTNYPQCRFTFNLEGRSKSDIFCPKCRKRLVLRNGKSGRFLRCKGYPECRFTFNIS